MTAHAPRRIVLALLLALAGCDPKPAAPQAAPERPPAPVVAATAASEDVPLYLDEIGRCVATESVTLQPQVSGRITKIHFADGADVKAGDPLFTIDPRPFETQLASAEASLAQERAALDLAKTDFARVSTLLEKKAAAQQEFDASKNAIAVSEAKIRQHQAAVEAAKLNLEYCELRSPIAGRAGHRLADVGNTVTANATALLVIQKLDPIYADFTVTERDFPAVQRSFAKKAPRAEVRLPDDPGPARGGDLTFIDNAVQDGTGTVKLRATLANADRRLWPGQFVKVRLLLDVLPGAVLVPADAPQMSAKGPYVYVVTADSTAEFRPVTLGQRQDARIVIASGLKPGERVITRGSIAIMPGGKVKVEEPKGATEASLKGRGQ